MALAVAARARKRADNFMVRGLVGEKMSGAGEDEEARSRCDGDFHVEICRASPA
jgi:DNA-binding FadR family transcriptional regulator